MDMPTCTLDGCDNLCHDQAYICGHHGDKLTEDLAKVSWLAEELQTVFTRQTASTDAGMGSTGVATPLLYDERASEAQWVLGNTLTTWARLVAEERGIDLPDDGGHTSVAQWLTGQVQWLRHHPAADEAYDELHSVIHTAERVVDLTPKRLYLGRCGAAAGDRADCPCDCHVGGLDAACSISGGCGLDYHTAAVGPRCQRDLYARPEAATVKCLSCGTGHDVPQRRAAAVAYADGHLGTAAEISALCRHMLGELVTPAMIRGYVRRDRIAAKGTAVDQRGRTVPAYRIGDVVDAAREADKTPQSRRAAIADAKLAEKEETALVRSA
ncbi:hypothetical protein [Enterococcus hirae]|uniref:hypothetical protein n=1 Tax=Enterococcus hirae TaxID=1354 RepID=UPI0013693735|nr:hypothetical protein [Enterococcus hirae]NAE18038.1 hypothetical protein [Enterococcus hirae]